MYEAVVNAGKTHSQVNAYEFQGKGTTYAKFIEKIDRTAKAFKALGIKEGETVTICMPNTPQGVDSFYAVSYTHLDVYKRQHIRRGKADNRMTDKSRPHPLKNYECERLLSNMGFIYLSF